MPTIRSNAPPYRRSPTAQIQPRLAPTARRRGVQPSVGYPPTAAWPSGLGRGLQSPVPGFDSRRRLDRRGEQVTCLLRGEVRSTWVRVCMSACSRISLVRSPGAPAPFLGAPSRRPGDGLHREAKQSVPGVTAIRGDSSERSSPARRTSSGPCARCRSRWSAPLDRSARSRGRTRLLGEGVPVARPAAVADDAGALPAGPRALRPAPLWFVPTGPPAGGRDRELAERRGRRRATACW